MRPLDFIKRRNAELLQTADKQLEQIGPSLRDLTQRILDQKPDVVIFLDKSARIFAGPMFRFLRERKLDPMPQLRFYNDDDLKIIYRDENEVDAMTVAREDFVDLRGKMIVIVDETFAFGVGANAMMAGMSEVGADAAYFALSVQKTQQSSPIVSMSRFTENLKKAKSNKKIHVYDNDIDELFSRNAARLYVTDYPDWGKKFNELPDGSSRTITLTKFQRMHIEDDRTFWQRMTKRKSQPSPEEKEKQENISLERETNMRTVKALRDKIYRTLDFVK